MPDVIERQLRDDGDLAAILGRGALDRLYGPIDQAGSLPSAAYTDPAFLALERARLFAHGWMLAGFAHEISEAGDMLPVEVAGLPLMLVRGRDGAIRAFHNVCPHRGTRLLSEPCRRPAVTCPYHAWTFDLDGSLKARPHFHGPNKHDRDGDEEVCLAALRCGTWFDLIFVNLTGDAPALDDFLGPATRQLAGYDLAALQHAGSFSVDVAANWKLVIENYIEPYHVFAVHPRLLAFAPLDVREPTAVDGASFLNGYDFPAPESGRGEGLPHFPGLSDADAGRGFWMHLFPSLSFEVYPDQFVLLRTIPLGPELTREEFHIYLIGEAATADRYAAARRQVFDTWSDLNDEDLAILEKLQSGRHSPGFDGGRLSPYWDAATLHFARLVADGLR